MDSYSGKRSYEESKDDYSKDDRREAEDGLGGYGDDDFTDVQSLLSLNKDGSGPPKVENFCDFPEIPEKTQERLKTLGITYLFPIQVG